MNLLRLIRHGCIVRNPTPSGRRFTFLIHFDTSDHPVRILESLRIILDVGLACRRLGLARC